MDEKKTALKSVEDTMACSAFAEAGEPCPINTGKGSGDASPAAPGKKESLSESVENTMACSAFAEAGEPCPIDTGKKSTTAQTAAAKTNQY